MECKWLLTGGHECASDCQRIMIKEREFVNEIVDILTITRAQAERILVAANREGYEYV